MVAEAIEELGIEWASRNRPTPATHAGRKHRDAGCRSRWPTGTSWLNQVEIWFSILSRKCLRYRSFESVRGLTTAIYRFVKRWNETMARPFEWTHTGKVLHA